MENIGRHFRAKFDLAAQLIDKLEKPFESNALPASTTSSSLNATDANTPGADEMCIDSSDEAIIALRVELEAARARYALCTSPLFFQASSSESDRVLVREEFQRIVASENFLGELDHLVRRVQVELGVDDEDLNTFAPPSRRSRPKPDVVAGSARRRKGMEPLPRAFVRSVKALIDQYYGHGVDCAASTVKHSYAAHGKQYNQCGDCRVEMVVNADTSELACPSCGQVRELIGTVFDDAQFYHQEGQKAKSGAFNPNRHFRFWMDRILAREPEEELGDKDDPDNTCGEKLLAQMRAIVRRDQKILRLLTVDDTRAMLKEAGRTDLNKNVPLLMRRLTGVGPPCLPEAICQRVEKLFSKAIDVGERVRPASRSNRNYYPYYIYKILDAILSEDDLDNRRVLYYIYMQGQDTLDKNDREWEEICMEFPEIEWAATNRSKAQKYRPL
ncbi:hypothetical protein ElyMa_002510500 [Elysia marginata]|uniref:Uncharacterized protein n=1 Tax=Elysia marginata TaxID=1093978 RepID=A0AAV4GSU6_9GAST|nr:hypothetical protein ElyMa_002510500 [Elysia marginata]